VYSLFKTANRRLYRSHGLYNNAIADPKVIEEDEGRTFCVLVQNLFIHIRIQKMCAAKIKIKKYNFLIVTHIKV